MSFVTSMPSRSGSYTSSNTYTINVKSYRTAAFMLSKGAGTYSHTYSTNTGSSGTIANGTSLDISSTSTLTISTSIVTSSGQASTLNIGLTLTP